MEDILFYSATMTVFILAALFAALIVASTGYIAFNIFFNRNAKPIRSALAQAERKYQLRMEQEIAERFDESEADIRQGYTKSRTGAPMALP